MATTASTDRTIGTVALMRQREKQKTTPRKQTSNI
ncbi:hypothetical protein MCEMSEM18_02283 [Comamonadaceae bacterium]